MDAIQRDLSCYQLARQLHLVPQLNEVFTKHSLSHPMFFSCLDPSVKTEAKLVLLCLQRVLSSRSAALSTHLPPSDQRAIMRLVLSFMNFSHLPSVAPLPRRHVSLSVPQTPLPIAGASPEKLSVMQTPMQRSSFSTAPPSPLMPLTLSASKADAQAEEAGGSPAANSFLQRLQSKELATADAAPQKTLHQPVFSVRPVPMHDRHRIFVRMVHTMPLNEESLNPFFGRYGQVGCELLRRVRLADGVFASTEMTEALSESFSSSPQDLLLHDFIVSVDSPQNAQLAVHRAYYKELLFIALHDDGESALCIADLDALMSTCGCTYLLAKEREAGAAVVKKRKRSRLLAKMDEGRSSSSYASSSSDEDTFIPDIVVTGFPYWITEDQLKVLLQEYGTVLSIRMSIDDKSGAFMGAVLVGMSSLEEAVQLSEGLHGTKYKGTMLISGIVNDQLDIVSLKDDNEVRLAHDAQLSSGDVAQNPRQWI